MDKNSFESKFVSVVKIAQLCRSTELNYKISLERYSTKEMIWQPIDNGLLPSIGTLELGISVNILL